MRYEWSDWIEHDGKGCPVKGHVVQAEAILNRFGQRKIHGPFRARGGESWTWDLTKLGAHKYQEIIRYRVRRPLVTEWLSEVTSDLPVKEDAFVRAGL